MATPAVPLDPTSPGRGHPARTKQPRILAHIESLSTDSIGLEDAVVEVVDEAQGRVDEG